MGWGWVEREIEGGTEGGIGGGIEGESRILGFSALVPSVPHTGISPVKHAFVLT